MTDWEKCTAIESDPERKGGAWVFVGTRVPIAALFKNLKAGATVHEFVEWFPGVQLEQVQDVLSHGNEALSERWES
jgi:uncharacterized protein (DUF433 family)